VEQKEYPSQTLYYLALVYAEQGRHSVAERTLKQALAGNPKLLEGWLLLMNLALERQSPIEAGEALLRLCDAMNDRSFAAFVDDQLASMKQHFGQP
jgi:hypothetical protein